MLSVCHREPRSSSPLIWGVAQTNASSSCSEVAFVGRPVRMLLCLYFILVHLVFWVTTSRNDNRAPLWETNVNENLERVLLTDSLVTTNLRHDCTKLKRYRRCWQTSMSPLSVVTLRKCRRRWRWKVHTRRHDSTPSCIKDWWPAIRKWESFVRFIDLFVTRMTAFFLSCTLCVVRWKDLCVT